MVKQERVAPRRAFLEFPAGQIDDVAHRLDPKVILATMESEMREEVGYAIGADTEVMPLGYYFTSQGFTDEHIYLFYADKVNPIEEGNSPDESESILGVHLVSANELAAMVASNQVCDSLTLALFARLSSRGLLF